MTTAQSIKCGLCQESVPGAVRELNRHKAEKHPEERAAMRAQRKARLRRGASINRCESCGKFVSLEANTEDNGIYVDNEGTISGSVTINLDCSDCSGTLATVEVSIEDTIDLDHSDDCDESDVSLDNYDLDLGEDGGGRFSKHLYYAYVSGSVTCTCEASKDFTTESEKVAASNFEAY